MTVRKQPDGKWSVDFYVDGRGSQRVRRGGFASKAHAQRFERDFVASPARSVERFSDLVDLWYHVHGVTLKNGARRHRALKQITERLKNPRVCDFTAATWSRYRTERLKTASASTINIEHIYVSSVFAELARHGHYHSPNPLHGMRRFRVDQKALAFLSFEQIKQLLAELSQSQNPYVLIIAKIALATGARWSEAERLRRSQLLSDRIVYTATKSGRNRTVPVDPALIAEALSVALPTERLFGPARGAYETAYARCGFKTPGQLTHILRHTFASHFVMAGGDIRTLKDILGHSDITTTMIYAHLAPEHLDKALTLNPLSLSSSAR
ncbi:phage integrase [Pseudomonas sp. Gutcm_11s]|uniref:phage integrase n=1 Tax=Pseudomonas sp. Gutcm_11s TaxID=3026088 RepID=UPI002360F863|nr:tyrosine-type recombinase/integrase [Pseudomonas sp. Gutcm_11s]MDD0841497.1 tyrosine-type recombinase/integrase [Pseudomonas sp. Gutcm_11s]